MAGRKPLDIHSGQAFFKCPAGHQLPYQTAGGECTALYCASDAGMPAAKALAKAGEAATKEALDAEHKDVEIQEKRRASRSLARKQARAELLKVPAGLTGQDAEDWVNRKKVDLTPYAIAELEYQLLYGDDTARAKAAESVLDRTGHGKAEKSNLGGAVIILTGGSISVPWQQRRDGTGQAPSEAVIDVKK